MFSFLLHFADIPRSKQSRPSPDAAFCGVGTGSAQFAYVPKTGFQSLKGKLKLIYSLVKTVVKLVPRL